MRACHSDYVLRDFECIRDSCVFFPEIYKFLFISIEVFLSIILIITCVGLYMLC